MAEKAKALEASQMPGGETTEGDERPTKMLLKLKEKADIQLFQSSGDAQAMEEAQKADD